MNERVKIMGILNMTPDSFYDGGRYNRLDQALERALHMSDSGADIIDIGGESTRPGAKPVPVSEEIDRVCPVIEKICKNIDLPVSIDTYKSEVAEEAVKCGARIINDISAFRFDENMARIASEYDVEVVLMHMKGTPRDMQDNPGYDDVVGEVYDFLNAAAVKAIEKGVKKEKIIVDPGIGFGKRLEDNYVLINNLDRFKGLGCRILMGLSRKSLIGKIYDDQEADRLPGTIALNMVSVLRGASIIRVHDVKEHALALKCIEMLKRVC